jgi:hypothetical protein
LRCSPWGYGWDTWKADFFDPAQALLKAAPWVMVRGNHETCTRAGQGWWRFLDPVLCKADVIVMLNATMPVVITVRLTRYR